MHDRDVSIGTGAPDFGGLETYRSLVLGVEAQAHYYATGMLTAAFPVNAGQLSVAYSCERKVAGVSSGICDGVVMASEIPSPDELPELCRKLQGWTAADIAVFRIASRAPSPSRSCQVKFRSSGGVLIAARSRSFREVLPLSDSYEQFLEGLGRSTRRNIRQCRVQAESEGIEFRLLSSGDGISRREFRELTSKNMPVPRSLRRVLGMEHYLTTKANAFRSFLKRRDGRMITVAGGFIERNVAYLIYQLNHRDYENYNASLMMRSFLLQHFVPRGVRYLAFLGGCTGLLLNHCYELPGLEALIIRDRIMSRIKHFVFRALQPKNPAARLYSRISGMVILVLQSLFANLDLIIA